MGRCSWCVLQPLFIATSHKEKHDLEGSHRFPGEMNRNGIKGQSTPLWQPRYALGQMRLVSLGFWWETAILCPRPDRAACLLVTWLRGLPGRTNVGLLFTLGIALKCPETQERTCASMDCPGCVATCSPPSYSHSS